MEDEIPAKKLGFDFDRGGEEEEEEGEEDGDVGDAVEDDESNEDVDSATASDHFDLLELGDSGAEVCQVGNLTCSLPFELYDLEGLERILSVDVWNEVLSEEERFGLAKYLPDMDLETFMITLKEIFMGCNFHFGCPIKKLFEMLKGGMCEPRVVLYREGLYSFQKRQHYQRLRLHQNVMVKNLCQIRDAWANCKGYSIEEKLQILNIMKSKKNLMSEMEDTGPDFSDRNDLSEALWSRKAKDRKIMQNSTTKSMPTAATTYDYLHQIPFLVTEPMYDEQNLEKMQKSGGSKMLLKKTLGGSFHAVGHTFDSISDSYSLRAHPRQSNGTRFDKASVIRIKEQVRGPDEADEPIYGGILGMDPHVSRSFPSERAVFPNVGQRHAPFCCSEYESDGFAGLPLSSKGDLRVHGRRELLGESSDTRISPSMMPNMEASFFHERKRMHSGNIQSFQDEDQMMLLRGRAQLSQFKEKRADFEMEFNGGKMNVKEKKGTYKRESHDFNYNQVLGSSTKMKHDNFSTEIRRKYPQEKVRGGSGRKERNEIGVLRGQIIIGNHDVSESDSFEMSDDEESNPLMGSKLAFPGGYTEVHNSASSKSKKKSKTKGAKESAQAFEGIMHTYRDVVNPDRHLQVPLEETFSSKRKKKGKIHGYPSDQGLPNEVTDGYFHGSNDVDMSKLYQKNGYFLRDPFDGQQILPLKSYPEDRKPKQKSNRGDYMEDEEDGLVEERHPSTDDGLYQLERKGKNIDSHYPLLRPDVSIVGCTSVSKRRKAKENAVFGDGNIEDGVEFQLVEESNYTNAKQRKKLDLDQITSEKVLELTAVDTWVADVHMEPEVKLKKKTFTLITPTVHTGFSFSIIHLLSAVRMTMISQLPEDSLDVPKPVLDENQNSEATDKAVSTQEDAVMTNSGQAATANVPSLTIQEIVNRVRSNPGDPCILETPEPLYDLVRGVLKILQSKSAPLGAKGWKSLVVFEKSTKSWSWIGPISTNPPDQDVMEEVTSPEVWALPHKMMVKLVDAFASWLKNSQETRQQIGSLPPPPLALTQCNLDEKERFRDFRAQKSLSTIGPSSDETRDYFRREEGMRYSIPDRAFSYTAADGKKSFVAPLRRGCGKPTSKARDHFMLKKDRPSHVTILCLVRDSAARLPGSIGTRADVCTLIRDSQFVVEDVSDAQVNQVVSGALDRLHSEHDPCVQFDSERKLWKYLHREREEEDFEDDGPSSAKKWKRAPKKDATELSDQGSVPVTYQGPEEQNGVDLCSDFIVEPLFPDIDKEGDPMVNDIKGVEEDDGVNGGNEHETTNHDDQSALWETLGYDPTRGTKLLCQENSTNNDFDDESFGQDR